MTWSIEDRERGLTAWVLAGSSYKASDLTGIPDATLRDWKSQDPERFDKLREDLEPRIVKMIAAEAESLVLRIADKEGAVVDLLTPDVLAALAPKDIASTLKNLSTSKALQVDKISSPLRERPSHMQHAIGVEQIANSLARKMGFDIDSTAVDETPNFPLTTESVEPKPRELNPPSSPAGS